MSPTLSTRAAVALLLLIPLVLLGPGMWPGYVLADHGVEMVEPFASHFDDADRARPQANADIVRENLVYRKLLREAMWEDGEIPWWEPGMYGGTPFVAMSHTQVFYPLTWLTLPLSPFAAHNWLLWLHTALAGLGAYAWFRAAGRSQPAAFFGGLVFLLNGMFATRMGHPQYVAVGCWLPWILAGVEHLFGSRRLLGAAGVAVATGMMILAGHPSIYVFGSYFVGLYLLQRAWRADSWRGAVEGCGLFALGYGLGVGLASMQFLALLEYSDYTDRAARPYGSLKLKLHHYVQALRIVFPNLTGTMVEGDYWTPRFTHYWAGTLYNGVAPLVLVLFTIARGRRRTAYAAAVTLLVVAILFSPQALYVVYDLPGFKFGRVDRLSIAWFLGIAWLVSMGVDLVFERYDEGEGKLGVAVAVLGTVVSAAAVPLVVRLEPLVEVNPLWTPQVAVQAVAFGLVFWLAASLLVAFRDRLTPTRFFWALVVLTVVDLGSWWREWAVARPVEDIFPVTETTAFLTAQEGDFRIAKFGGHPDDHEGIFTLFPSNLPAAYGIEEIHGFGPLHIALIDDLYGELEPQRRPHAWHVKPLRDPRALYNPILDLMNVRYVLAEEELDLPLVADAEVRIYENPGAFPRVWFAPRWSDGRGSVRTAVKLSSGAVDPHEFVLLNQPTDVPEVERRPKWDGQATLVSRSRNALVIDKTGKDAGWVVMSESWYPGWTATVDGEPAPLLRANVVQRAVHVGEGDHRVEVRYRPTFAHLATVLTLLSLLGVLALVGLGWRSERAAR